MNNFIFDSRNVGLQSQAQLDASLGRIQPAGHLLFITNTDKILHFEQKKKKKLYEASVYSLLMTVNLVLYDIFTKC